MHRLDGQPWFPEEVKINKDSVQNLSAQQLPYMILYHFLHWKLQIGFGFLENSGEIFLPDSLLAKFLCGSAAVKVTEDLCFFQTDSSSFSRRVKWKEARLMSGKFRGTCGPWELRNSVILFSTHIAQEPQLLLGKTTSWRFAIHSHLLSFAEVAKQGCWLKRAEPGPRGRMPAPLTTSQQRHYFLSLVSP